MCYMFEICICDVWLKLVMFELRYCVIVLYVWNILLFVLICLVDTWDINYSIGFDFRDCGLGFRVKRFTVKKLSKT